MKPHGIIFITRKKKIKINFLIIIYKFEMKLEKIVNAFFKEDPLNK